MVVDRPPKLPEELASKHFFGCFRRWTGFFLATAFFARGFLCLITPIFLKSSVLPRKLLLLFGPRFFLYFTIFFVFY